MTPAPSRRMARVDTARATTVARKAPPTRWSRRRGVLNGFAVLATVGFVAAYAVPTGAALADSDETSSEAVSAFASASEDAQVYRVSGEVDAAAVFSARVYSVHVPPPPPPPEPEPEPAAAAPEPEPAAPAEPPADEGAAPPVEEAPAPPQPQQPPQYSGGGSPEQWMTAAGIAQSDWGYVDYVVSRESGWNPNAINPSSGACGLVQIMPMHGIADCRDPVVNLRWGNNYAVGRYGSWAGAYNFWINNNWW